MHYEGMIIRPPSEANSILLQVTVGCSHNKCTFCGTFAGERFKIKSDEIVDQDIQFAKEYCRRQRRVICSPIKRSINSDHFFYPSGIIIICAG